MSSFMDIGQPNGFPVHFSNFHPTPSPTHTHYTCVGVPVCKVWGFKALCPCLCFHLLYKNGLKGQEHDSVSTELKFFRGNIEGQLFKLKGQYKNKTYVPFPTYPCMPTVNPLADSIQKLFSCFCPFKGTA